VTQTPEPWSVYWQDGALNSCITGCQEQDARIVNDFWQISQRHYRTMPGDWIWPQAMVLS